MVTPAETSNTQVALLHRISSIVSSDQDIESILQEMVSMAMNVTHSHACLVYLIDYATNEVVLRASQLPRDAAADARLSPSAPSRKTPARPFFPCLWWKAARSLA